MPISYAKMVEVLAIKKVTSYTIKRDNVIGQASYKKIMEGGHIDTRTIEKLCAYLDCQPGDLMEYIPDDAPAPDPEPPSTI